MGLLPPDLRPRPRRPGVSLQLVSEQCPSLTFLKLSDCHGVTAEALGALARACSRLHSLDLQHSMVSPGAPGLGVRGRGPGPGHPRLLCCVPQVESAAVLTFLEEAGARMRKLWLTYSSQTTAILGALLVGVAGAELGRRWGPAWARLPTRILGPQGGRCPQLQVLELSTGLSRNSTPLQLPVEGLQKGCPQLQVPAALPRSWGAGRTRVGEQASLGPTRARPVA